MPRTALGNMESMPKTPGQGKLKTMEQGNVKTIAQGKLKILRGA